MPAVFDVAVLSLISALTWGVADFTGGLISKRANVYGVVILAHFASLILIVVGILTTNEAIPSEADLLWGMGAGVALMIGMLSLYRALSTGQMGIVAPIAGVLTASIPVVFSALTEELPSLVRLIGFATALIGIWQVSRSNTISNQPKGLGYAFLSGLGYAGFFIMIAQVNDNVIFYPLLMARLSSIVLLGGFILFNGVKWMPPRNIIPIIALISGFNMIGNITFIRATQAGQLAIASVLGSLYPVFTILLAMIILKETMSIRQLIGIALTLIAIVLIVI